MMEKLYRVKAYDRVEQWTIEGKVKALGEVDAEVQMMNKFFPFPKEWDAFLEHGGTVTVKEIRK